MADTVRQADREGEGALEPLAALHERSIASMRACLDVLARQEAAVRAGRAEAIRALSALESGLSGQIAVVERVLLALERGIGEAADLRSKARELREERSRMREAILDRNRGVRSLLEAGMRDVRRSVARRRAVLGAPSPYAALGDAVLVDLRT